MQQRKREQGEADRIRGNNWVKDDGSPQRNRSCLWPLLLSPFHCICLHSNLSRNGHSQQQSRILRIPCLFSVGGLARYLWLEEYQLQWPLPLSSSGACTALLTHLWGFHFFVYFLTSIFLDFHWHVFRFADGNVSESGKAFQERRTINVYCKPTTHVDIYFLLIFPFYNMGRWVLLARFIDENMEARRAWLNDVSKSQKQY